MYSISSSIKIGNDVDKLIQLKIECQLLLTEIETKIEEIESI